MIEISVKRGERESGLTCDDYVLVAWNQNEDGTKSPVLNASSPPEVSGADMVYAVGVMAIAMEKNSDQAVKVVGALLKSTLEKGLTMLEAASEPEIKA
jgi:hypothetical protein